MLRTLTVTYSALAGRAPAGRRALAPWDAAPAQGGPAAVADGPHPFDRAIPSPWGESPRLRGLAVVTTEAFPPEWRRRDTRPSGAGVSSPGHSRPSEDARQGRLLIRPSLLSHEASARFARLCLVVAGVLILWMVVEAAADRAHQ